MLHVSIEDLLQVNMLSSFFEENDILKTKSLFGSEIEIKKMKKFNLRCIKGTYERWSGV